MTESTQTQLNLSDAYRTSQSKTSIFCGIDLRGQQLNLSLERYHLVELENLSCQEQLLLCSYRFVSFTPSPDVQPNMRCNQRMFVDGNSARFDFKLSLNLVRGSSLMLATSGLHRSISTAGDILPLPQSCFLQCQCF